MGEIKSTLELVMERTRHLSLTDAEKAVQAEKEARDRMRGLLQRFEDNVISVEELKETLEKEQSAGSADLKTALLKEALERIGLEKDIRPMAVVLEDVSGVSVAGLEKVVSGFEAARLELAERSKGRALADMEQRWGVSGTAVVPNLEKDTAFAADLAGLKARFEKDLQQARDSLLSG